MSGNAAIGEAAIRAGCQAYFGYPITPQNELTEYMAAHLSRRPGCTFIQAESEISAVNMVYGASLAGARAMTSSSSPGISLKQEGISYLAACQLPAVIVNMSRGGPGLGSIVAAQSDYFQATRGGGHGDYRTVVLAPSSVQELADLTHRAFDLADRYLAPVLILGDGRLHLFTTNRSQQDTARVHVDLADRKLASLESAEILTGPGAKAGNSFAHPDVVRARPFKDVEIAEGQSVVTLPPLSFAAMTFRLG